MDKKTIILIIFSINLILAKEKINILELFNQAVSNQTCKLPNNRVINIYCTKKCNKYYISALNEAARELNYNISIIQDKININNVANSVDAILSPGGYDILPKYFIKNLNKDEKKRIINEYKLFGKTNSKSKKRDEYEYNLFIKYFQNDKFKNIPVLGVCYGMQMLASVNGIPLYVDLKHDIGINARRKVIDNIYISKRSLLYKMFGKQNIKGYKNHHQAINLNFYNSHKNLFSNAKITATSNNGKIAEILEFTNRPAIGIQFHAERSNKKTRTMIYKFFLINACKKIRKEYDE